MIQRFDGSAMLIVITVAAVTLTTWQVAIDRSVFDDYFGRVNPILAMITGSSIGGIAMASLERSSDFAVVGPGRPLDATAVIAWTVPLFAIVAIGADVVLRFDEDTNVALPDALRFYPAIAVFVELVLHAVPIALLVAIFGPPTGLDATLWRIAIPVAAVEAALQAAYATSAGTAVFSAIHLALFGVTQVWMFWRYGFVWMLGFRLAYYSLWHIAWGAARLDLLF